MNKLNSIIPKIVRICTPSVHGNAIKTASLSWRRNVYNSLPNQGFHSNSVLSESDKHTETEHESMSFIEKAKNKGADVLLGSFISIENRFDYCLKDLKIDSLEKGEVTCSLKVTEKLENSYRTLHGGVTATIVDVAGTIALLTIDPKRAGVSVEMSISYTAAAKHGEELLIKGKVLKSGKRLGFTEVTIHSKSDNKLIATGRHTKAL